jgi:hypothetical protein
MIYLRIWIVATVAFMACTAIVTAGYYDIEGTVPASPPVYVEMWAGWMGFITVSVAGVKWLLDYRK